MFSDSGQSMRRATVSLVGVFVLFSAIAATVSSDVRPGFRATRPAGPVIGAHYYPWYEEERWVGQPVAHTPKLGRYSSSDRAVVAEHIRWAQQADIDFFMLSCLAPNGREAINLREAVLPELERASFRFALHYETPIALGLRPEKPIDLAAKLPDGTVAGDRMIEHFDHLAETYFRLPNYLRCDGKVVVMLYLVRNFEKAGRYLKTIRERAAARGLELYLIADAMYWEKPGELDWPFLREHFQAVTAYNMYDRPNFLRSVERQYAATDRAARSHGMRMIPHVMPGYDDTRLRGAGRAAYDRDGGQFYRDYWRLATEFVVPDQRLLLITTFNEWHEGTELEPSEEYGDLYLRLTRAMASDLRRK